MSPEQLHCLILGAGSQLTPFLSQRLAATGYQGTCVSRTPPPETPAIHPAFPWRRVDLAEAPDWPATGGTIAFSVLPLWLLPTHVPALAASGVQQLIAFSSTSVFAKADSPDPAEQALAERLAEAESATAAACEAAGIPWTILRPTLIYGSGRDQNVSAVARFARRYGFFPVAHPAAGLRQPVHADDLAQAAVAAIGNPKAYNRAFDLPGGETLTYRHMVERVFEATGRSPRILPLPTGLLQVAMRLVQDRLPYRYSPVLFLRMNQDLTFDAGEAVSALGYNPRPFTPERV
jgi:nucleoside-diphosphate-sugar epimerase